jgi:hypothetical protein
MSPGEVVGHHGRKEMNVSVSVPEELYRRAAEVAAAENVSVDDVFASAFEERLLEFERLKEKSSYRSYQKFLRVMSKVPAVKPPEFDRLTP